jgi:hypothetical protein
MFFDRTDQGDFGFESIESFLVCEAVPGIEEK